MDQLSQKSLVDMVLGQANLLDDGKEALRRQDYAVAIEKLSLVIDNEKANWDARFLLATAYQLNGQVYVAGLHFRFIADHCPTGSIADKARQALEQAPSK